MKLFIQYILRLKRSYILNSYVHLTPSLISSMIFQCWTNLQTKLLMEIISLWLIMVSLDTCIHRWSLCHYIMIRTAMLTLIKTWERDKIDEEVMYWILLWLGMKFSAPMEHVLIEILLNRSLIFLSYSSSWTKAVCFHFKVFYFFNS